MRRQYFARALHGLRRTTSTSLWISGVAAASAGHYGRAHDVFEARCGSSRGTWMCLYRLAAVEYSRGIDRSGGDSGRRRPRRSRPIAPDVQKLLAAATGDLGALDDSIAAWERYLKLVAGRCHGAPRARSTRGPKWGRWSGALADLQRVCRKAARRPGGTVTSSVSRNRTRPIRPRPRAEAGLRGGALRARRSLLPAGKAEKPR